MALMAPGAGGRAWCWCGRRAPEARPDEGQKFGTRLTPDKRRGPHSDAQAAAFGTGVDGHRGWSLSK